MPVHAEWITSAEYCTLGVAIPKGESTLGTEGVLGRIVNERSPKPDTPVVLIECVLCEMLPPTSSGPRTTHPTKWPGRIFMDGEEITPRDTEQESVR